MTVGEMLAGMSSSEFTEWAAHYATSPWGEERADWRAGIITATLANINRPKGKSAYKPSDFMPDYEKSVREVGRQPMHEQIQRARAAHAAIVAQYNRTQGSG